MSVCPCAYALLCVPSCPAPKPETETENFAKESCQIYFKGAKKILSHAVVPGEAKPSYIYSISKPHFRVSSPP